ncbi:YbaB/EbfC family nucleoid-associated protein [Kutzneria viridogrisea]|uniref:Nucleoid-associated protein n=2 Tax=Kutzneria TaxID=43356 RepID=W5WMK9_9PSEU|nr:YbaB/EbfC family nucleoid-associated protein [Kutzneria albida]AHH99414.1 hypothetical protein KALB_6054 [Kutzneria albida DSM 43870]MBA8923029.1 hypothetical protein [Kutzneria viridogrisea]
MDWETGVDVEDLLSQVRRQQEEVERIQAGVQTMQVRGSSRGGEVTVSLKGDGRFTEISIDPDTARRYNARDLGEIVLEAVNDGLAKLAEATTARFAPVIEAASRMENLG